MADLSPIQIADLEEAWAKIGGKEPPSGFHAQYKMFRARCVEFQVNVNAVPSFDRYVEMFGEYNMIFQEAEARLADLEPPINRSSAIFKGAQLHFGYDLADLQGKTA